MSTIKVDSIQNTSGVEVFTAKSWINFNGTGTVSIRQSGNMSSLTDLAVGVYTFNYATALNTANYAICGAGNSYGTSDAGGADIVIRNSAAGNFSAGTPTTMTTTATDIIFGASGASEYDAHTVTALILA